MALDKVLSLLAYLCRIFQRVYTLQKFLVFIIRTISFNFRMCETSFYRHFPAFVCKYRKDFT